MIRTARLADRHALWRQHHWPEWRYGALLARAAATRSSGACYAHLVAGVELLDAGRRRQAMQRIGRWQRVPPAAALGIFHGSLLSEAREEADSADEDLQDAAGRMSQSASGVNEV